MTPAKAAALVLKFEKAEADLVRTFTKWQKLRAAVRRADAALDREHVRGTKTIRGDLHPGDLHPEGRAHLDKSLDRIGR